MPPHPITKTRRRLNKLCIACAGSALICDGYHNTVMTALNLVFKKEYPVDFNSNYTTRMNNAMLVGQILGMCGMGLLCDYISRKSAIVFTTLCMVIGSILACAAHGTTTKGMFWMIIVMRGLIGFGIGGEFPTCSSITLEATAENEKIGTGRKRDRRGWLYILIFNIPLQMGSPFSLSVFLIVWEAAGGAAHLSTIWRVMFGIGASLPLLVFILRMKLITSNYFKEGKFINYKIPWLLTFKFYWKRLFGTCFTFLLYDMIIFPNSVFSALIIKSIVKDGDTKKTAEWDLLLGALTVPGVLIGSLMCEKVGRKRTMLIGFGGFIVFGVIIGCAFDQLKEIVPLFVVFYGLFQMVGRLGPGSMIGLMTSESYATGVRASFFGLSNAIGRVGGIIGTEAFTPIKTKYGQRWTFITCACVAGFAMVFAWLFMPDLDSRSMDLEDERFMAYLRANGFNGEIGFTEKDYEDSDAESQTSSGDELEKDSNNVQTIKLEHDTDDDATVDRNADSGSAHSNDDISCTSLSEPKVLGYHGGKDTRTFWQRVFSMRPLNI